MAETDTDTIAAIATAAGPAGVGVVRLSGPAVPAIAECLLGRTPQPRHAHYAAFRAADGQLLDRGLLLYFPAPDSYTGEAVLELQGHGNPLLLDALLRRSCALGARLARPGEFTERAFLNGKLDLAQAEAVADLIAAQSIQAARAALRSLEGDFSREIEQLLAQLIAARVHIEAAIDFPEEDIDFLADPAILASLQALQAQTERLLEASRQGVRLGDGWRVAIIGRPNMGKSSLLNALAGRDRAIVTEMAGTTRDVLRETIRLDGLSLELADTAGLRETADPVEREGIRRARAELGSADAVLLVTDAAHAGEDRSLLQALPPAVERFLIVNKIDRDGGEPGPGETETGIHRLSLSVRTGAGLPALRESLKQNAVRHGGGGDFSARRRHVLALETVQLQLQAALDALNRTRAGELAAEELRRAQQSLAEITGHYTSDDLLGAIFGSFCIGK